MTTQLLGWAGPVLGLLASLVLLRLYERLKASLERQAPFDHSPVPVRPREDRPTGSVRGVRFPAHDGTPLDGWLFTPREPQGPGAPIVVLAPGLGGTKDALLEPFAWRFVERGVAALVFDHRCFGGSDGTPRHWVDPDRHCADYRAAIAFVRRELGGAGEIDASRIALWGSSFSGGTSLVVAAHDPDIRALVVQCPFLAPSPAQTPRGLERAWFVGWAALDLLRLLPPIYVPLFGRPGERVVAASAENPPERALRERDRGAFGAAAAFWQQVPERPAGGWENRMLARGLASIDAFVPLDHVGAVRCPILFVAGRDDDLIPLATVERAFAQAGSAHKELEVFPCGHFDLYAGPVHAQNAELQAAFLARHLGVSSGGPTPGVSSGGPTPGVAQ